MRIEISDVSSIARYQAKKRKIITGLITGYARNVATFNSHQSAYISCYLLVCLCIMAIHATRRFFLYLYYRVICSIAIDMARSLKGCWETSMHRSPICNGGLFHTAFSQFYDVVQVCSTSWTAPDATIFLLAFAEHWT